LWSDLELEEELELEDQAEELDLDSGVEPQWRSSRAKVRSGKSQANYEMQVNKELDKAEKLRSDKKKLKE